MINLTPHAITLVLATGEEVILAPSGIQARVEAKEENAGMLSGMPVISRVFGEVTGLPEDGSDCLVSALVLSACPGRKGVYAPDTGPTAVRFGEGPQKGQIKAVTRLVRA